MISYILLQDHAVIIHLPNLTEPTADTYAGSTRVRDLFKLQRYLPVFEGVYHIRY
jgi:hypothetical protein